ncbi:VOC family protein [Aliiglaciecola sp. SL4]|uniref:VOC family protein n=1 Tax=Aliiglaciecola sp. SL4 TaxID=3239806 RepID=UPI00355BAEA2
MSNPVGWFEIYVDDMDRAKAFYEKVFKTELEAIGDLNDDNLTMVAFPSNMEKYGAAGALVKMAGFSAGGNSTLVYFSCDDCAIEGERVTEAGGQVQQEKMSIGNYGFIILALDSEGNMFGLHSLK